MSLKIPEPRSIVGYGYSKLIVLPIFWIKHHGLKRKDKVLMEVDNDGRLIIQPEGVAKNESEQTI